MNAGLPVRRSTLAWVVAILMLFGCRAEPAVTPATETVIFPQYELIEGEWAALTSAIAGDLVEVDGCLRIDNRYGTSYLVIWGPLYELASSGEVLQIRDGTTGQVVARVGEAVHMGGGEGGEETEDLRTGVMPVTEETVQAVEASGCPGPYWYGGEIILSPTSSCELPYVPGTGVIPATPYPEDATIIENEGFVCFYPTPDSSFNVQLSAAGCHASHCTIVYERTGDVEVDLDTNTIQFYSRFVVESARRYWLPGTTCACADDCGGAGDLRFDIPSLPDGLYRVRLGDMQIGELRVPSFDLYSCLESSMTATLRPPTPAPTPTRDPAAYPLPTPYPAPAIPVPSEASP